MECQEAKLKIFSFLDEELSPQEEREFFEHLDRCRACSVEFDNLEATHHLLKQALVPEMPPLDLTDRIMAQIPQTIEPRQVPSVSREKVGESFFFRLREKLQDLWGKGQFRMALVTAGMLVLFAATGMMDLFSQQTIVKQNPDRSIAQVEPENQENPDPQGEAVVNPEPEPETKAEDPVSEDEPSSEQPDPEKSTIPEPQAEKPKAEKETPVKKDTPETSREPVKVAISQETNLVQLPKAAAVEKEQVTGIKVIPLLEGDTQKVTHPILAKDGKTLHYLYDNAGVEEEWEISLTSGAVPQKAEILLIQGEEKKDQGGQIPSWLEELAMMQEAKSKKVALSPDNRQVAINLNAPGTDYEGLWVCKADGSMTTHLTDEGGGNQLKWSPNASKIAFTDKNKQLYVFYLKENILIQLADAGNTWLNIDHLLWTRGGQELIFEGQKESDQVPGIFRVVLP